MTPHPELPPIKGSEAGRETRKAAQAAAHDEYRRYRIGVFNDETAAHLETERLRRLNRDGYVKESTRTISLMTRH